MANKYTVDDFPVHLTVSIEDSLHSYFSIAQQALEHFSGYEERKRTLDYPLMQRFLRTTYKTLHDLDPEFMEQKLQVLYVNLEKMAKIVEDFKHKSKHGLHSYAFIFLSQQEGFVQYESQLMHNSEEIAYLRMQTQRFLEAVERQHAVVEASSSFGGEKKKQELELKRMKRLENNAVVRLGELVDQNAILYDVITAFKKKYEADFLIGFSKYTHALKPQLLFTLNAMAFEFDIQMWHKCKESKIIQNHFKNSHAAEVVSSRTYLEYYLRHLDENKLNQEHKNLSALLKVLKSSTPLKIMMYMSNVEDLIIFKSAIESDGSGHEVISYTDAKPALKTALTCNMDIIFLDLALHKNILESFMHTFNEHTKSCSKFIKFIFVSDFVDEKSLKQAQELGADSLIERELDAVEVLDAIYTLSN